MNIADTRGYLAQELSGTYGGHEINVSVRPALVPGVGDAWLTLERVLLGGLYGAWRVQWQITAVLGNDDTVASTIGDDIAIPLANAITHIEAMLVSFEFVRVNVSAGGLLALLATFTMDCTEE